MKRGVKAYFTVEAVMVLPVVLGAIGVILYLLTYQYDRAVLEQDMGMLSIRVSSFGVPMDGAKQELVRLQEGLAREKYLLGIWTVPELEIEPAKVTIRGKLQLPLWGPWAMSGKGAHGVWVTYTNRKLSPVFVIRSCKKITKSWGKGEN